MSNIFNPLVSIVIPVYNGSNYMREAIDSALAQTYKNIEVIVVNDGSTDNTDEIAKSYGDKIRYFSKENGGVATALNLAIKEAKGEYISWLSHDDLYYPNKIQRQIETLKTLEDKNTIIFSDIEMIDENSKVFANRILKEKYSEPNKKNPLFWLLNGLVHGCSLLIKKYIFFEFNLFDESLRTVQDYALWYDIFKKYKVYHIDEILIQSREHPEQGHITLSEYIQKEQTFLWNKMILGLTIKEVGELLDVPVKKLGVNKNAEDIENIELVYAPRKVLRKILKLNKKTPFTAADIKPIFKTLAQYKTPKLKYIIKDFFLSLGVIPLGIKLFFENKKNTVLMFEPNPYHGETFAGYINYLTELNWNVHFVAQDKLKKENPFTRIQEKIENKSLKVFYAKYSESFVKKFFKLPFLKDYKKIFITTNLGYFKNRPLIVSKAIPLKLRQKAIIIEHDTKNFSKADEKELIKNGQIATLIKRKFKDYSTKMINPCTFGKTKRTEKASDFSNFTVIGCMHKDYKGGYLIPQIVKALVDSGYENFKITVIGTGELDELDEKYQKFVDIKGRLAFEDMFREVENAQYLMFLLDSKNKEHCKYLTENVTGALQLSLGFGIIPILHKSFADVYGLSKENSFVQEDETFADIMKKAIELNSNDYKNMQLSLEKVQNEYYKKSLEAVKNAINE